MFIFIRRKKFTENFWNIKPKNNYLSKISLFDEKDIKKTKIRIGYFSADFNNHAVFQLIQDLFVYHNKLNFEIYAYSFLKKEANVVFLNCSVESQYENTKNSAKRPLLLTNDPKLTLQTLYEKRFDSYKKVSKLELLSDSMSNDEIANKIINHFNV